MQFNKILSDSIIIKIGRCENMDKFNDDNGNYLCLLGYPNKALVERYRRDSVRVGKKWQELHAISGDANKYFFGQDLGFWSNCFFEPLLEAIASGANKRDKELLCQKIDYLNRVEPKIENWIKEAKCNGTNIKNNGNNISKYINRWFSRFPNWLFKKKQ